MNWFHIAGIILIAFGTLLTYYGSHVQSRKDKSEFANQHKEVLSEIEAIRSDSSITEGTRTSEIGEEYLEWSENFFSGIDELRLKKAKSELDVEEQQLALSNQYRYLYASFLDITKSYLEAYNHKTIKKIEYQINKLIPNLFRYSGSEPVFWITFDDSTCWFAFITVMKPGTLALPWIQIQSENPKAIASVGTTSFKSQATIADIALKPSNDIHSIHYRCGARGDFQSQDIREYQQTFKKILDDLLTDQIYKVIHQN